MIFSASPRTRGGKRATNGIGCSEGSTPMRGDIDYPKGAGTPRISRAPAPIDGIGLQSVRRYGLRASRVPKEDAANGETRSGFGGVATSGTDGGEAMTIEVFESVWDALEDTPTEAENMRL